uniref:Macro domain-containing protein n=1 Tax=Sinocyclocheilus anshuiensis TaxID=1608454 RepID=A0A671P9M3_9TELE
MTTVSLLAQDLAGRLDWINPTQCRCGSGQIPWHEVRMLASVVNLRICENAEIPPFIYSSRGGRDGYPKVRVFDEFGAEIRNIPTKSWDDLDEVDTGEVSECGSLAPNFIPHREGNRNTLDPSAPQPENPESPDDEFSTENEEPLRIYFGRGKNLIILKEGYLEVEEEACVLVNAANTELQHGEGVAGAFRKRAGQSFQDESNRIMERRKNPIRTGDAVLQKKGGPNGNPVIHAIGHRKGQNGDISEELTAILTLDTLIDNICKLARDNKYRSVAMPIISGGIFGFNEITVGAALVNALLRKTDGTDCLEHSERRGCNSDPHRHLINAVS